MQTVQLSDSAATRILALRTKENNPKLMLRVTVLGGGCSGFQYALDFTDTVNEDDVTFEKNGAALVTDTTSLPMLAGSEVDFEQTMVKSAFKIRNPNAASGCGCGKSFGV
jgi:iron-sulfur cluster insertion protein